MRYLLIIGLFISAYSRAQDIIILDEGYNTDQRLDVPIIQRGNQYCISTETNELRGSDGTSSFVSGSLCEDQSINFQSGSSAVEYQDSRTYSISSASGAPANSYTVRLKATINDLNRGEHGNWVSNAAYEFDRTLTHRLWQVFGISRSSGTDNWVTVASPGRVPGETIRSALDVIGILDLNPVLENTVQRNLVERVKHL